MRINKIKIQNFKSIANESFIFNDVNVLIGANASGKSNFVQIFDFLKNIKKKGFEDALIDLGGISNILNFNTKSKRLKIVVEINPNVRFPMPLGQAILINKRLVKNTDKIEYELVIRNLNGNSFEFREELSFYQYFSINHYEDGEIGEEIQGYEKTFEYGVSKNFDGTFRLNKPKVSIESFYYSDGIENAEYENIRVEAPLNLKMLEELNQNYKYRSVLEYSILSPPKLLDFGIYDIDTKALKKPIKYKHTSELSKNGDNLPIIVRNILSNKEIAEQFTADIISLLDFIEDIQTRRFENIVELWVKEKYNKKATQSNLLSDGTIAAIAFTAILYYQNQSVIFIEEPEHSLHPSLIGKVLSSVYDAVEYLDKQIFITTHSPELLRYLKKYNKNLDDLILIVRDEESGHSVLRRPIESRRVKIFLKNELGLDELFIDNLLND